MTKLFTVDGYSIHCCRSRSSSEFETRKWFHSIYSSFFFIFLSQYFCNMVTTAVIDGTDILTISSDIVRFPQLKGLRVPSQSDAGTNEL